MRETEFNILSSLRPSITATLLVSIGMLMVVIGLRRIQRGRAMTKWLNTDARITRSQTVPAPEAGYDALIEYEYEVRGQRHRAQVVIDGDSTNMDVVDGEWRLKKYTPGDALLVHYDPLNPEDSVIRRYSWSTQTSSVYVGGLLLVLGVLMVMAIWI